MNPAYRYRRVGAGPVHNLNPPPACHADVSDSRQGTPAQLVVFGAGKSLKRCRACAAAEVVADRVLDAIEAGAAAVEPEVAAVEEAPA